jgi:hypothetical protein
MPAHSFEPSKAHQLIELCEELLRQGFVPRGVNVPGGMRGAWAEAAHKMGYASTGVAALLARVEKAAKRQVRWGLYNPAKTKTAPRVKAAAMSVDDVRDLLLRRDVSVAMLADKLGIPDDPTRVDRLTDWVTAQKALGHNVSIRSGLVRIDRTMPSAKVSGREPTVILSDKNNRFVFGASGDQHLCSKYARLDVLNDLYDRFARAGVQHVFNTGNWIDGEARFNTHDLLVHGFEAQLRYLAEHFPKRRGIQTHAVWGDDHEGWYGQRFGVDVGLRAEQMMRAAGRTDWHDLGFMEAHVVLRNANTGKEATMLVVHPGGGSAYATSYTMQKLVESLDGGEKPAILLAGHYHKLEILNARNVFTAQTGTTQDQTPFMRKKKLEAHVGGLLLRCEQDPETGAIIELNGLQRYFVQGYYNGRWSPSGDVVHAKRGVRP